MPTTPLISVIIPNYNSAQYLPRAIASVLKQQTVPLEIIVVDDGSQEEPADVLKTFGDHVILLRKPNGGPASARNFGIQHAQGQFMALLDADDEWVENKLAIQLKNIEKGDAMIGTNVSGFHPNFSMRQNVTYEDLLLRNLFCNSSVLIRRECLKDVGGFDESESMKAVEDWDMWLRIARVYPVKFLNQPLAIIHELPGSLSSASNAEKMLRNELAVLAKHFQNTTHPISHSTKNNAFANRYFASASALYQRGNTREARRDLFQSLRYAPLSLFKRNSLGLLVRLLFQNSSRKLSLCVA